MKNFSHLFVVSIFVASTLSLAEQKKSEDIKNCILHQRKDGSFTYKIYTERQFDDGVMRSTCEKQDTLPQGWKSEKENLSDIARRLAGKSKWIIATMAPVVAFMVGTRTGALGISSLDNEVFAVASVATILLMVTTASSAIKDTPQLSSNVYELIKKGKRGKPVREDATK